MDDWRERLHACGDPVLANALIASIEELLARDEHILRADIHENAVAAQLMSYLRPRAPMAPDGAPWDVHIEYNRQGLEVKTIRGKQIVRPDLILHRVNTDCNCLAVELKKGPSPEPDQQDAWNLQAYRWPLNAGGLAYAHALFLRLGVGHDAGKVTCIQWY